MRSLLVLTTFAGIASGVYVHRSRIDNAVGQLESVGAKIEYHPSSLLYWHRLTGNFFANVKSVQIKRFNLDDQQLRPLRYLTRLETLSLRSGSHLTVARLKAHWNLSELSLSQCRAIDTRAIPELKQLRRLKRLDISKTGIGGSHLRQLAGMPCLEELTFSAGHKNPMNAVDIQYVASLPKATAIFQQYLSNINDDDLLRMLSIDLSKNKSFVIYTSRLTRRSLEPLGRQHCSRIEFHDCPLDSDAISGFDWQRLQEGKSTLEFQDCGLSLADLSPRVAPMAHRMMFNWSSRFEQLSLDIYDTSSLHGVTLTGYDESDITTEALRPLVNLESVYVGKGLGSNIFRWMIAAQPQLKLDIHYRDQLQPLWDAVEQTPSPSELVIHADDYPSVLGTPKFSSEHQLKYLSIALKGLTVDQQLLEPIANLTGLERLGLYHCQPPGPEVARLGELPRLSEITIIPALKRQDTIAAMQAAGFAAEPRHRWQWTRSRAPSEEKVPAR
ncbi:MAG: hypothetical protein HKN47_15185 [Pirellulaceae bacterium]|nr:hypothetical protein [Pirellulaceae bacterium]